MALRHVSPAAGKDESRCSKRLQLGSELSRRGLPGAAGHGSPIKGASGIFQALPSAASCSSLPRAARHLPVLSKAAQRCRVNHGSQQSARLERRSGGRGFGDRALVACPEPFQQARRLCCLMKPALGLLHVLLSPRGCCPVSLNQYPTGGGNWCTLAPSCCSFPACSLSLLLFPSSGKLGK